MERKTGFVFKFLHFFVINGGGNPSISWVPRFLLWQFAHDWKPLLQSLAIYSFVLGEHICVHTYRSYGKNTVVFGNFNCNICTSYSICQSIVAVVILCKKFQDDFWRFLSDTWFYVFCPSWTRESRGGNSSATVACSSNSSGDPEQYRLRFRTLLR